MQIKQGWRDSSMRHHRAVSLHAFLYILASRSHEEDEKSEVPDLTGRRRSDGVSLIADNRNKNPENPSRNRSGKLLWYLSLSSSLFFLHFRICFASVKYWCFRELDRDAMIWRRWRQLMWWRWRGCRGIKQVQWCDFQRVSRWVFCDFLWIVENESPPNCEMQTLLYSS